MKSNSDVMNALEAASFLGVHVETLRKLARRNEIPSFKVGRDWRFRRESLLKWAEEQQSVSGTCSILIIDDELMICKALTRMVERFGCRVRYATSAMVGLELIASETPNVILLDLAMPEMNGPQFLLELRKKHPELPVVIITGYPNGGLVRQATKYPPLMLLPKPVESSQLTVTLRSILGEKVNLIQDKQVIK